MTPKTYIIYLWRHQDTPNNSRKILNQCLKDVFLGNRQFGKLWKRRGPENPDDPFNKILNMGSLPIRKHEMEMW